MTTVNKTYIDVDALFSGMRAQVDRMLGRPPRDEQREEHRDENGARVVQLRVGDGVRPKDGAG